jgi:histidine triad (HIT) family protein
MMDRAHSHCIFCRIVQKQSAVSMVFEDDNVAAFMTIKQTRPGECLVIPKRHIDHFQDLDDLTATAVFLTGQKIARKIKAQFNPLRVGYVVSGFGVAHAHLVVVPLHDADDITSKQLLQMDDSIATFSDVNIPQSSRAILDQQARSLQFTELSRGHDVLKK